MMVTDSELLRPAPLVAEHMSMVPAVLEVRFVAPQPVDELIPDSGSVTLQLTVTLLVYHPLAPSVPVIVGTICGGVVSGVVERKT